MSAACANESSGKGGRDTLQPMPWPSLFIYLAQVQLKTRATIGSLVLLAPPISLWMESCFHNEKIWKRVELELGLGLLKNAKQIDVATRERQLLHAQLTGQFSSGNKHCCCHK